MIEEEWVNKKHMDIWHPLGMCFGVGGEDKVARESLCQARAWFQEHWASSKDPLWAHLSHPPNTGLFSI